MIVVDVAALMGHLSVVCVILFLILGAFFAGFYIGKEEGRRSQ